jgi:hypothetical protein
LPTTEAIDGAANSTSLALLGTAIEAVAATIATAHRETTGEGAATVDVIVVVIVDAAINTTTASMAAVSSEASCWVRY